MSKPLIGVFFGSRSAEHDISVMTAIASVIKPLKLGGQYKVLPVYITKQGKWYADERLGDISLFTTGKIDSFLKKIQPVSLDINDGFKLNYAGGFRTKQVTVDIAFPALHGTYGEDGDLMGVFEMANVPYVGCSVAASAVAMDKVLSKQVTMADGIPSSPWVWTTRAAFQADQKAVVAKVKKAKLKYPIFVKPAHLGSSIGITRVATDTELVNAIEVASHYDDKIIIEQGVSNLIEVTLPIIGNDSLRPALLEQPMTKAEDFFDFETKYMQGGKKGKSGAKGKRGAQGYSQLPADLPKALYEKAEQQALATYSSVGCSGIARIDMLIDSKTEEVYFNEINPLPGDLYRHNWSKAGLSTVDLVHELIRLAQEQYDAKQAITTTFSTSYLKQF